MSLALDPTDRGPDDDVPRPITTEEAFEALSNRRRRFVIRLLADGQADIELRELSRRVAAWENDKPVERVTATERRRVYNALQQFHLPKLDDAGVVDYDDRRGIVASTEHLASLRAYLAAPCRQRWWRHYYLLVGAGFLGLLTAGAVGLPPFAALPGSVLGTLLAVVVTLSATAQIAAARHDCAGSRPPSTPDGEDR